MTTLYLCGAGNPEGIRLALTINKAQSRWDRIIILDDDPSKHGQSILGVEIAGPFDMLGNARPDEAGVSNMVAKTTKKRQSALQKIQTYGLPFVRLIDPEVDITDVQLGQDITIYRTALLCALASVDEGSVVLMGAIVGHRALVGRRCVVAPGAVISARVEVGDGVYVGTNASILPDLKIGAWATIGANSAVVQDVPEGATVMGVPAQMLLSGDMDSYSESMGSSAGDPKGLEQLYAATKSKTEVTEGQSDALRKLRAAQVKFIAAHKSGKSRSQLSGKGKKRLTRSSDLKTKSKKEKN